MGRNQTRGSGVAPAIWSSSFSDQGKADFKTLLQSMADEGRRAHQEQVEGELGEVYEFFSQHYIGRLDSPWRMINDDLDQHFKAGSLNPEDFRHIPCIVLRPAEKQCILPVLIPKFVFARSHAAGSSNCYPELRLRLALFYRGSEGIRVAGHRFEVPEGPLIDQGGFGPGTHDYPHVQYVTHFRKDGPMFQGVVDLPVSTPAWPIWADDPLAMLATVWIGLYGRRAVSNCGDKKVRDLLQRHASRLSCSPQWTVYEVINIDKRHRGKYIVLWSENKECTEIALRAKYNVDKRVEILRHVSILPPKGCSTSFWNLDIP